MFFKNFLKCVLAFTRGSEADNERKQFVNALAQQAFATAPAKTGGMFVVGDVIPALSKIVELHLSCHMKEQYTWVSRCEQLLICDDSLNAFDKVFLTKELSFLEAYNNAIVSELEKFVISEEEVCV